MVTYLDPEIGVTAMFLVHCIPQGELLTERKIAGRVTPSSDHGEKDDHFEESKRAKSSVRCKSVKEN